MDDDRILIVRINTENAAFDDEPATELARILRDLADKAERGDIPNAYANVHDINGNVVGVWALKLAAQI